MAEFPQEMNAYEVMTEFVKRMTRQPTAAELAEHGVDDALWITTATVHDTGHTFLAVNEIEAGDEFVFMCVRLRALTDGAENEILAAAVREQRCR